MAENAILLQQTLTILQQMEELKNWHKQQQSKLNPENTLTQQDTHPDRDTQKTKQGDIKNVPNPRLEKNKHYNPASFQNFDETPIKVANPDFNGCIENNMAPNEAVFGETQQNKEHPKFKYLKKGEGIARFHMGPQKINKYRCKKKPSLKLSSGTKVSDECPNHVLQDIRLVPERGNDENRYEMPNLNPSEQKLDFKNWKSIFSSGSAEEIIEKAIDNNQLNCFQPDSSIDSSTASIMEKLLSAGRRHLKEREELRIFEMREQHVMDSSFCSSSSYVSKLLENAVKSTPVKKPFSSLSTGTQSDGQLDVHEEQENVARKNNEQRRPETPLCIDQENTKDSDHRSQDVNADDLEQSLHVRFAEEVDYKSFIELSRSINNSSNTEKHTVKEFDDSKEWKEDSGDEGSCSSQGSTVYSSSDEDVRAISPPVKPPSAVQAHQTNNLKYYNKSQNHKVERLSVAELKNSDIQNIAQQAASINDSSDIFPPVLGAKLKELENEIAIFREENNKLKALREGLEKDHKQFQLEKKKLLKEMEEEKKKNYDQLKEEKQKLAKEKSVFEKYSKSLTKHPTKEERKEVQGLREQLSEMKEELNKKESRWGAAQARVRNQLKLLEEDNKKLREEVEVLRKQSKHLEFLTKKNKGKVPNNTKLIHAINDHISNIAVENSDNVIKSSTETGYFGPKTDPIRAVVVDEVDPKSINSVKVIRENMSKPVSTVTSGANNCKPIESSSNRVIASKDATRESNTSPLEPVTSRENTKYRSKNSESPRESDNQIVNNKEKTQITLIEEHLSNAAKETVNDDFSVEEVFADGRKEIRYKNGNVKKIDPCTGNEKTIYFNGDVKEITWDGTVKYYFSENRIWHTTLPDGLEVLDFPNGQVEKRHLNGTVEIVYPNDCQKLTHPDGSEEIYYADGTSLKIDANNRKVLSLPNGQKEIHTDQCIWREYPDGTVKTVYPDGTTETVYSNGRVRLKDKHGNLVMDSGTATNFRL